ncbi:MAG: hypothetical protein IJV15_05230 [Lachnospiraceae bacterium]|nr:hypothetical protein [Lachnospiraceae bacterium]
MFLAISGSNLFIIYMIVIIIIAVLAAKNLIKKNRISKKNSEEKMGELNAFILQYEASKKVAAEKEKADKQPEQADKLTEDESNNTSENKLDAETIVRINALYHDAEMSVEQISSKTGVSIEQIKKVIG